MLSPVIGESNKNRSPSSVTECRFLITNGKRAASNNVSGRPVLNVSSLEASIARPVDLAHASGADSFFDLVRPEPRSSFNRHVSPWVLSGKAYHN